MSTDDNEPKTGKSEGGEIKFKSIKRKNIRQRIKTEENEDETVDEVR